MRYIGLRLVLGRAMSALPAYPRPITDILATLYMAAFIQHPFCNWHYHNEGSRGVTKTSDLSFIDINKCFGMVDRSYTKHTEHKIYQTIVMPIMPVLCITPIMWVPL